MTHEARPAVPTAAQWDQRFAAAEPPYGEQPSLFLVEVSDRFRPGQRALVPADGGGRNGVWLAGRGLAVTSVDCSGVALDQARALAGRRGVRLATEQADLLAWSWPRSAYDVVASVYFHVGPAHRPRLHRAMLDALVPGGLIVLEAFHAEQMSCSSGGPRDPEWLLTEDRLRADFAGAEILVLRKDRVMLDEGPLHRGEGVLVRMLARRTA